jgi:hypothetical protein
LKTKTSKSGIFFKWDRGGINEPAEPSTSRLTGCTFIVVFSNVNGEWNVRKVIAEHNHPLGGDINA